MPSKIDAFEEFVDDLYHEYIENQRGKGVWNVEDAWAWIFPQLEEAIAKGKVRINLTAAGRRALKASDVSIVAHGRTVLKKERARADQFSLDDGAWLDVLIPLGKSDRCQLADFGLDEYNRSLALKNENIKAVIHERDEHVEFMAPYVPYLQQGLTMRDVFRQGLVKK